MPFALRPRLLVLAMLSLLVTAACDDEPAQHLASGLWVAYPSSIFGDPGPLHLVHVESGRTLTAGDSAIYHSVTWSPTGDLVAAVRDGPSPELVMFPTGDATSPAAIPLPRGDTALYWSPDGLRVAAVSLDSVVIYSRVLEPAASFMLPEALPAENTVGEGLWADTGQQFAVPFRGYVLVAGAAGRWTLLDPADFVRRPGETVELTVMGWAEGGLLAIFEEAAGGIATRYVLDITESPPRLSSSSDYPAGAGPMDGLIAEAMATAGGRDVLVGRRGQPSAARWVVAEPRGSLPPALFVRPGERFIQVLGDRFAGADPAEMAADMGLLVLQPNDDP